MVRIVTNITKEYPAMIKVIVYKEPHYFVTSDYPKRNKRQVDPDYYSPSVSSLTRTKSLIKDIVLCNSFELFCTFTFNPTLVDSFSFPACYGKMSRWLHHQRDLSRLKGKEFKYLIIPEKHKSGRYHFHALISGYSGSLRPSKLSTATNRPIFNITSFRSGFTTAVPIDSQESVATYVSKYITKDFIKTFNQRRFFCSRNLKRPVKTVNSWIFRTTLPIFRKCVGEDSETFQYEIPRILY